MARKPATTDDPPKHVMEVLPVERDEWRAMTDEERAEVVNETVENFVEAMQPVVELINDEIAPAMIEMAQTLGDTFIDMADEIENAQIDHDQMTPSEQAHVNAFVMQARQLEQTRNRNLR